jgi:hypothetical protein
MSYVARCRVLLFVIAYSLCVSATGCQNRDEQVVAEDNVTRSDKGSEVAGTDESGPFTLTATRALLRFVRELDRLHLGNEPRIATRLGDDGIVRDEFGNVLPFTQTEWDMIVRLCGASIDVHGDSFVIRSSPHTLVDDDYGELPRPWYTVSILTETHLLWTIVEDVPE